MVTFTGRLAGMAAPTAMSAGTRPVSRIDEPLPDLQTADLPEKTRPNWKLTGPGAILVGLSIGAGEIIIIWPRSSARN